MLRKKTPINRIIFDSVSAYDLDGPLYNEFEFYINEKDANETYFSIETNIVSSGHYNGTIRLLKTIGL